ncbi:hypothetical protein EV361DRAFT_34261 [Lentinula raphanica]|nr:hypothetical protein EV361DRAFT_34261 [Lentinula raphanica]
MAAHNSTMNSLQERVAVLQEQNSNLVHLKEELALLQFNSTKQMSENAVLTSEKTALQNTLEKQRKDISELKQERDRNRSELFSVLEKQSSLQSNVERLKENSKLQLQSMERSAEEYQHGLTKQEEASERLLGAVVNRAEAAEQGLVELTRELTNRIGNMEMKFEMAHIASNSGGLQSSEVNDKIRQLEAEIECLRERGETLEKRYHSGDLNDEEKRFVNFLMRFSQDVHEKAMVAKENELRRRDNMVTTLQSKVGKLESTLAKYLKDKGKGDEYVIPDYKEKRRKT